MIEQSRKLLQKYFGYSSFKAGQAKVIGALLEGSDTLAIMPTGAGDVYKRQSLDEEPTRISKSPLSTHQSPVRTL